MTHVRLRGRQEDRGSVHLFKGWRKALLLGLLVSRLYEFVARVHALLAADSEGVEMTEPLACKVPDCDRTRAATSPDFCLSHEYEARLDALKVVELADHVADRGAGFDAFCAEHGLPDPHEK